MDPTDRYSRAWQPIPPCSQFNYYACFPASSSSFSLFQRPFSLSSWRNEKSRPRSYLLESNLTVEERDSLRENHRCYTVTEYRDSSSSVQSMNRAVHPVVNISRF